MNRFPPPPPGAERRVHPRLDVVVSVEVAHDDAVAIASLVNISHGGAFIELSDPEAVAIGVRVKVHVAAGGHRTAEEARVIRVTTGEHAGFAIAWVAPGSTIAAIVDHLTAEVSQRIRRLTPSVSAPLPSILLAPTAPARTTPPPVAASRSSAGRRAGASQHPRPRASGGPRSRSRRR